MAGTENFNDDEGLDGDAPNLYDLNGVTDYDTALEYAAQFYLTLAAEAQEDARIVAVSEMGAVQVVGTGAVFPANDQLVLQGPCILVYAKDVREAAADIQAQQS